MGNASGLAGLLLLLGAIAASPTSAQTAGVDGAYARLSLGHQKIARALFDAQAAAGTTLAPAARAASKARTLTLDQIAAQKQGTQGWGPVFWTMRGQGLVQEKSLGEVVSRYELERSASLVRR